MNTVLEERLISLDNYGKRENLIVYGIEEKQSENCDEVIRTFLKKELKMQNVEKIKFQRVHRLPSERKPRPMIIRFMWYADRNRVWEERSKLKKTKLFLSEDFSKEYASRRRTLYPVWKRAKDLGHTASLRGDSLIIDNKKYNINNLNTLPLELQPAHAATRKVGEKNEILAFFTGATPLSNFFKTDIKIDGKNFTSVEQFFQYKKALFAERADIAQKIHNTDLPAGCKHAGDGLQVDNDQWLPLAKQAMYTGCLAKFQQDCYARSFLVDTENLILAEASNDKTWGIGMSIKDEKLKEIKNDTWQGQNLLGNILMRIRNELKIENSEVTGL